MTLFVALIDEITISGSVGLSVHGLYRVITERTIFAMPKTSIGLYPNVEGSYFLLRLKGRLGIYLGLTENRLKGKDVYFAAIATHYIRSQDICELEEKFISQDNITDRINREILNQYHMKNDGDQRFYEGAKAVLIDRDHNPKWDPATLEEVTDENINAQFKPSDDGDLILPRQQFL
ncbi:uncharacterized protein TRIADDRAFT_57965 [Trichoplax adhaerens]|uniref:3-hydroxyisobutyryl-CoA hydrolase, mitochondrial n=1 Tax=Trichoplax adhaerens TaxID=10228 RepID=B3S286_TRIAD|nr:hypothetical protein TRIADDRAFT_57965 [Trichoplax adhaerens]EDV23389.1 hypothetical protein TRIADDRAFT_57965 [Trichoplax adhaerens]|eukprot:XP_002114299.1 hypothetical protein TRIADDRAFT_57965 [Trichoplax adhaerens]